MEDKKNKLISIVCPVYNESGAISFFVKKAKEMASSLGSEYNFELIFVDDGSEDGTDAAVRKCKEANKNIRLIRLSRNFGKEAALTAGLDHCLGDAAIPIDVDLQDPLKLIPVMIAKWGEGYDCVLAKRIDRKKDSFLKRTSSTLFYRVHNKLSPRPIPENVGDFRLIDRKVIDSLSKCGERERFMKGLFSWVGFKTVEITYQREKRVHGESKFNFFKLWRLALDGVTGFSTAPLKIWTYLGIFLSCVSFIYIMVIFFSVLFGGVDVPGYASLLCAVLFLGGVQLMGIGILGEYVGRIYMEVKERPLYVVESEE